MALPKMGSDHTAMRNHNERLVLSIIRHKGALAKSEIARLTGLSAQTVSVIMRALETEGLLLKCDPVRGKVGQPTVPMRLNPEGGYFLGLKVGRRRSELMLIDFLGQPRASRVARHDYPTPDDTVAFARRAVQEILAEMKPRRRARVFGMGIGAPFQMWDWGTALGLPPTAMSGWRRRDIRAELEAEFPWPVLLENDASAACNAELLHADEELPRHFIYAFLGFFVGGGLVMNASLVTGSRGNAGALASMPVPDGKGGQVQLLDVASLSGLEARLRAQGQDSEFLWESRENWSVPPYILDPWMEGAAKGLAHIAASAGALCDLEAVVIDGWMPDALRARLVAQTRDALAGMNHSGMIAPRVLEGHAGADARAIGAASLPLAARFLTEFDLKDS
ncbi:ROK family transcriptional regulator [Thioclava dalianensis]|uniref:ROK family transcriptional regulator n=2 Tax=Thioclava dalianensis TaxID=1185766 RepID=A0A074TBR9_9RHOB|nr:ROK family transcriptional regulator [Thioclava dalianensis]KEP69164.1 ROK family transcriptional regulator [Thioclava dalianensis]SFM91351.1 Sugar kinase of the NBD/HSP70 family, may contain an N-terminal HTH domain [Thioclava dalianensis]